MTKRQMLRYEIHAAAQEQTYHGLTPPKAAAIKPDGTDMIVEFWAESGGDDYGFRQPERTYTVIATGSPIPVNALHVATTPRSAGGHVLHLYEIYNENPAAVQQRGIRQKYGDVVDELRSGAWHQPLPKRGHIPTGPIEPPVISEAQQVINDAFNKPGEIHGG